MTYAPARPSDRPPAHHASEFSNVRPFPANESEGERAMEGTQERERLGMRCQSRLRSLPQNSLETRTFYYARQRGRRAHARQSGQSERARNRRSSPTRARPPPFVASHSIHTALRRRPSVVRVRLLASRDSTIILAKPNATTRHANRLRPLARAPLGGFAVHTARGGWARPV